MKMHSVIIWKLLKKLFHTARICNKHELCMVWLTNILTWNSYIFSLARKTVSVCVFDQQLQQSQVASTWRTTGKINKIFDVLHCRGNCKSNLTLICYWFHRNTNITLSFAYYYNNNDFYHFFKCKISIKSTNDNLIKRKTFGYLLDY